MLDAQTGKRDALTSFGNRLHTRRKAPASAINVHRMAIWCAAHVLG